MEVDDIRPLFRKLLDLINQGLPFKVIEKLAFYAKDCDYPHAIFFNTYMSGTELLEEEVYQDFISNGLSSVELDVLRAKQDLKWLKDLTSVFSIAEIRELYSFMHWRIDPSTIPEKYRGLDASVMSNMKILFDSIIDIRAIIEELLIALQLEPLADDARNAVQLYFGNVGKQSTQIDYVVGLIMQAHESVAHDGNTEFISIIAPSLTGKTLLSHSLDGFAEHKLLCVEKFPDNLLASVFRLSCSQAMDRTQLINKAMIFSEASLSAAQEDLDILRAKSSKLEGPELISSSHLSSFWRNSNKSALFGLFCKMASVRRDSLDYSVVFESKALSLEYTKMSLEEALGRLRQIFGVKPIAIVLDEFNIPDDSAAILLCFYRNMFRVLRTIVICMGTDSKASNMLSPLALGSSSGSEASPWTQIVIELPDYQISSTLKDLPEEALYAMINENDRVFVKNWIDQKPSAIAGTLHYLLIGLLSRKIHEPRSAVLVLDEVLIETHGMLRSRKAHVPDLLWNSAQFFSLKPSMRYDGKNPHLDAFLNSHYAFLENHSENPKLPFYGLIRRNMALFIAPWTFSGDDIVFRCGYTTHVIKDIAKDLTKSPGGYDGSFSTVYEPRTAFPAAECNEATYLALFQGRTRFIINSKPATIRKVLPAIYREYYGTFSKDEDSVQAPKRDGNFLEDLARTAVALASRVSGLAGSKLPDFILSLSKELCEDSSLLKKIDHSSLPSALLKMILPLVPVIGGRCSLTFAAIPGVHTGTLHPLKDIAGIDGIMISDALKSQFPGVGLAENKLIFTTLECKNHIDGVGLTKMRAIMTRAQSAKVNRLLSFFEEHVSFVLPKVHLSLIFTTRVAKMDWDMFFSERLDKTSVYVCEVDEEGTLSFVDCRSLCCQTATSAPGKDIFPKNETDFKSGADFKSEADFKNETDPKNETDLQNNLTSDDAFNEETDDTKIAALAKLSHASVRPIPDIDLQNMQTFLEEYLDKNCTGQRRQAIAAALDVLCPTYTIIIPIETAFGGRLTSFKRSYDSAPTSKLDGPADVAPSSKRVTFAQY